MPGARIRLACLWISQTARALADNCLRLFVVLQVAQVGQQEREAAWYQVNPFFFLPFIVLAPLTGAICNGLPRRRVLVGSAAFSLAAGLIVGLWLRTDGNGWAWCAGLGVLMIGTAVFSPTRYAMLPAAADDTGIPLTRINGWIEMGCAVGVVGGMLLGIRLYGQTWASCATYLGWPGLDLDLDLPPALGLAIVMNLVCLAAAWPVFFAADVRRPEPAGQAVAGFFRDSLRIGRDRLARASLLGLAGFLALVVIGSGAILEHAQAFQAGMKDRMSEALVLVGVGGAAGSLLASVQGHLRRALGLVPLGVTGMVATLAWANISSDLIGPCLILGILGGLVNVPLRAAYQAYVPADARGNGMTVLNTAYYLLVTLLAVALFGLAHGGVLATAGQLNLLSLLAAGGACVAWWALFRDSFEQGMEMVIWPVYRIRGHGPGLPAMPVRGPLLVIANHTAWLDPLWVGKVMPRRLFPMMTSEFYDIRGLRWLLKNIFHVIRVQASGFRREAPELDEAIALLDQGECVCLFPEGRLRRVPEPSVRHFGQGIWHILRQRPGTPVVACWTEGGWGSYTSYFNGPPTVRKRFDWWRHIDVAVSVPQVLPEEILADQRATRLYLMRAVLEARGLLGLEVPLLPDDGKEKEDAALRHEGAKDER